MNIMDYKVAVFNNFTIKVPEWVVDSCPQSGDVTNSIREFLEDDDVKKEINAIDPDILKSELSDYGAWDDEELNDLYQNRERILWIAIGDIWEQKTDS